MKTSKKILSISVLSLIAILSLTGCNEDKAKTSSSSNSNTSTASDSTSSTQIVGDKHIQVWHAMGKENLEAVQTMTEQFLAIPGNEEWTVEFISKGNYDQLKSDALKAIPAQTLPTVAMCYPDHVADYLKAGVVEKLDSYIEASDAASAAAGESDPYQFDSTDYIDAFWQEGAQQVEDGMYSVPFSKSTEVMFYNKTFFDKYNLSVPKTWDQMETLCAQILAIDEVKNTANYEAPLGYDSDDNMLITFFKQLGIPYTSIREISGKKVGQFDFNNQDAKDLVTKLVGWRENGYITTKALLGNNTYTSTKFTEGTLHMTVGSTGGTRYNFTSNFKIGVAPLPQWDTDEEPSYILQGPSYVFFNKKGDYTKKSQIEFAWKWYTYITNPVNSASYAILTGYEPVRYSSYQTEIYEQHLDVNPDRVATTADGLRSAVSNLTQTLQDGYFTTPVFVGSATARTSVGGIFAAVCSGTSVTQAFESALNDCILSQNV